MERCGRLAVVQVAVVALPWRGHCCGVAVPAFCCVVWVLPLPRQPLFPTELCGLGAPWRPRRASAGCPAGDRHYTTAPIAMATDPFNPAGAAWRRSCRLPSVPTPHNKKALHRLLRKAQASSVAGGSQGFILLRDIQDVNDTSACFRTSPPPTWRSSSCACVPLP